MKHCATNLQDTDTFVLPVHFRSFFSPGSVAVYYLTLHSEAFTKCHTERGSSWACVCLNCRDSSELRALGTVDPALLHNNLLVIPLSLWKMPALVHYTRKCKLTTPQHYLSLALAILGYILMKDRGFVCTAQKTMLFYPWSSFRDWLIGLTWGKLQDMIVLIWSCEGIHIFTLEESPVCIYYMYLLCV